MLVFRFRHDTFSRAFLFWSAEAARARQEEQLNDVIALKDEEHTRTLEIIKAARERRKFCFDLTKCLICQPDEKPKSYKRSKHDVPAGNVGTTSEQFAKVERLSRDEKANKK